MKLVIKKSECKKNAGTGAITSLQNLRANTDKNCEVKYCIIVKPLQASLAAYEEKIFNGTYIVDGFSKN